VNLFNRNRPSFGRFTFVFVGLAISIFTWGLQYKVSLYYPPHSTYHQIPEAKLLSRDEQAPATEGLLIGSAKAPADVVGGVLFALTLFACALRLLPILGATQTEQERTRPWLVSLGASLNAFFFRPPPAFDLVPNS
jgi:hypothetical protein